MIKVAGETSVIKSVEELYSFLEMRMGPSCIAGLQVAGAGG